jgi:hypothetical protein
LEDKWVEVLKEIAPSVARFALMVNAETAPYAARYYQQPLEGASADQTREWSR